MSSPSETQGPERPAAEAAVTPPFVVVPCVDVQAGRAVRLSQGDPDRETVYFERPPDAARHWLSLGARELHVVDLDAALGRGDNRGPIREVATAAAAFGAAIEVGGGVRSRAAADAWLATVDRVVLGTVAVTEPALVRELIERHGPDRVVVSVDARGGLVALRGWRETAAVEAVELARKMADLGVRQLIYTDVSRDGTLEGVDREPVARMRDAFAHRLLAGGGVATDADLDLYAALGLDGAIVGRALYEGRSAIPELPEVETVRRELAPWLTGRTVLAVERVDAPPGPKTTGLERAVGQRIEAVCRRGKFLLLPLARSSERAEAGRGAEPGSPPDDDGRDELIIHLGMTGVLTPAPPAAHLRLRLRLDGPPPDALHFQDARRFGRMLVVPRGDYRALPTLASMGPEPLDAGFTAAGLAAALARSAQPIKAVLLSQRPVSGVGNIYADEALWRARVHPETPARALSRPRVRALHGAIREVLAAAVELQGTTLYDYRTVNGDVGAYRDRLDAYGHAGDACPRCGTAMVRIVVGQRGTHLCPRCQRRPGPASPVRLAPRARRADRRR